MIYDNVNKALQNSCSDKAREKHQYGVLYNWIFNAIVSKVRRKISILEIGVSYWGEGASLNAFASLDFCEKAVGVDICHFTGDLHPNSEFHLADGYSDETIEMLSSLYGSFDILIDDATHTKGEQLWFIKNYEKLRHPEGVLIVEDVNDTSIVSELDSDSFVFDGSYNTSADDEIVIIRGDIW